MHNWKQWSIKFRLLTGVVTTGKVVGCILLATDELLRVEELAVSASPHLINHSGLKINEHSTGDMLPSASLTEEGVECIITSSNSLVTRHLTISLNGTDRTELVMQNNKQFNCRNAETYTTISTGQIQANVNTM
jgi:hypothetical protein